MIYLNKKGEMRNKKNSPLPILFIVQIDYSVLRLKTTT